MFEILIVSCAVHTGCDVTVVVLCSCTIHTNQWALKWVVKLC